MNRTVYQDDDKNSIRYSTIDRIDTEIDFNGFGVKYVASGQETYYINGKKYQVKEGDYIIGNEDCGQMSAWYLFSSLGFYPINPFDGTYVMGNPQFKKIRYSYGTRNIVFLKKSSVMANHKKATSTISFNGKRKNPLKMSHSELINTHKVIYR